VLVPGNSVLYVKADAAWCLAGEVVPWCYGRFQQAQELLTYQWVASTSNDIGLKALGMPLTAAVAWMHQAASHVACGTAQGSRLQARWVQP
jgi:hypothetical protein